MAYLSLWVQRFANALSPGVLSLQPARFGNGPSETQAADKLPRCR